MIWTWTWYWLFLWVIILGGFFVIFIWLSISDYDREKKLDGVYLIASGIVLGLLMLMFLNFLDQGWYPAYGGLGLGLVCVGTK